MDPTENVLTEGVAPGKPLVLRPLARTARDAEAFAKIVHADQQDDPGLRHVRHLKRVAILADDKLAVDADEVLTDLVAQIAWLKDTFGSTPYTREDLIREGFAEEVLDAVQALTEPTGEGPCLDWTRRFCETASLPAILVKLAENEDRSKQALLSLLSPEARERAAATYTSARAELLAAATRYGWVDLRPAPPRRSDL
jgi:(p)ppGpp synthase/HD superfamily hydrolase